MSPRRPGHTIIRPQIRNQPAMNFPRVNTDLHRLHWNENPFDFPADLKEEVLQRLARTEWSRYPLGLRGADVCAAVAKTTALGSDQVVVGNGSTDLLRQIFFATLQAGDHVLTLAPTYRAYTSYARQIGAETHEINLDPNQGFALPVDTIINEAARHHANLIAICAPNNPTGTIFPLAQLRQIAMESDAIILIDAAYGDFCGQDLRPLLAEADNVVTVHTMSKSAALAGIRVGYALSTPQLAQELTKLVPPFVLNPFSESAAIVALENQERFQPMINCIVAERERLAAELARLPGVLVYPSGTNFLFVKLGFPGKAAVWHLRNEQSVLISDMGMYSGYEDHIRISIGTRAQNDSVVNGLAHYLATVTG